MPFIVPHFPEARQKFCIRFRVGFFCSGPLQDGGEYFIVLLILGSGEWPTNNGGEMKTVQQMLQAKGHAVWSIESDATVFEALTLMAEKNIGALVVFKNQELTGIFSERDYARRMILKGKHSKDTLVGEVMSGNPICIGPDKTVEECMELMTEKHIRHLPVMKEGKLLGVISIGDVVKAIITEQEGTITHLKSFITGR
jgi:CBS domain-containing protein